MTGFLTATHKNDTLYVHSSTATVARCAKNLDDLLEKLQRFGVARIPVSLLGINEKKGVFLKKNRSTVREKLREAVKSIGYIPSNTRHSDFFYTQLGSRWYGIEYIHRQEESTTTKAVSRFHIDNNSIQTVKNSLDQSDVSLDKTWAINLWGTCNEDNEYLESEELRTLVIPNKLHSSAGLTVNNQAVDNQAVKQHKESPIEQIDSFPCNDTEKHLMKLELTRRAPQQKKLAVIGLDGKLYCSPDNNEEILVFLGNIVAHSALMPLSKAFTLGDDQIEASFDHLLSLTQADLTNTQHQRLITLVEHHLNNAYFISEANQIKTLRFLVENNRPASPCDQQQKAIINRLLWENLTMRCFAKSAPNHREYLRLYRSLQHHFNNNDDKYDDKSSPQILQQIFNLPNTGFCLLLKESLGESSGNLFSAFRFCSPTKPSPLFDQLKARYVSPPSSTIMRHSHGQALTH